MSNPMKDYVDNFRASLPSGVTYDADIARYFANGKRFLNEWEVERYINYIQKFGFSVSPIEAVVFPNLGTLVDGETIASAMSADYDQASNYTSSGGTIDTVVASATVNGSPALFTDTVSFNDVVSVSVVVTDSASNERDFNAGLQSVQGIAPTALTAPTINGAQVGSTPSATPGTYSGTPTPTVLGAFTLDGAAFEPPTELQPADEGKTLAYIEAASNGITPDAQGNASVTVSPLVENWTPEQLSINSPTRRMAWYVPGETPTFQDAGETVIADTDGDSVERWGTGAGGEAGMTLETVGTGDAPVLATRDGVRVLRFTDGVTKALNLAFASSWSRPTTFYVLYFNDPQEQVLVVANDGSTSTQTIRSDPAPDGALDLFMGDELENFTHQAPGLQAAIIEADNAEISSVYLRDSIFRQEKTVSSIGPLDGIKLGAIGSTDYAAIVVIEGTLTQQEIDNVWQYGIGTLAANSTTGHSSALTHENNSAFKPDIANARIVISKDDGYAPVTIQSFWGRMTEVLDDPDFDNVLNVATGERLNYLLYSSTDHASVTPTSGGIYLTCVFGDPVKGTYKAYADALAAGDLDNYVGSKPAAADSKIFSPGWQAETPQVIKIGTDWVMLYHGQNSAAIQIGNQVTYRASSSSPFGGFVKTPTSYDDDDFLSDDTFTYPNQNHTGYATVMKVPPESTFPGAYFIGSLWNSSGGSPLSMLWEADSNLLNPVPITPIPRTGDVDANVQTFTPAWVPGQEVDSVTFSLVRLCNVFWTGSYFRAILHGNASGRIILFEVKVNPDLVSMDQLYAEPIIGPDDLNHLFFDTDRLSEPQIITRPSGGLALVVAGRSEDTLINHGMVMPLDYDPATPRIISAPRIIGILEPNSTVTIRSAIADASPEPTVTNTLLLNGSNVTGDIVGGEYLIPPTATPGDTLALTSTAANGTLPNASETVSVEIVPEGSVFTFDSLYQSGEDGLVMDMGDLSTLYLDAGRTEPVTTPGQEIRGFTDVSGNGNHGATATGELGWEYRVSANGSGFASQAQLGEQFDAPVSIPTIGEVWTFFIAHDGTFEDISGSGQFMMASASNEGGAGNSTSLVGQENSGLTTFGSETFQNIRVDGAVITPADRNEMHDQVLGTSTMIYEMVMTQENVWTQTRIGAWSENDNRQPPKGVFVWGMINRQLTEQEKTDIESLFASRTA